VSDSQHETERLESEVPVLTQIVEVERNSPPGVDPAALEALARELERAVLARLGPEIDRATGQALDAVRAELTANMTQMVREAVAASVAHTLALPKRD
jgi:hypothetical protein